MDQPIEPNFVDLYTGELWQVTLLQTLLESHHIRSLIKDVIIGNIEPLPASAEPSHEVILQVSDLDFDSAAAIVLDTNTTLDR